MEIRSKFGGGSASACWQGGQLWLHELTLGGWNTVFLRMNYKSNWLLYSIMQGSKRFVSESKDLKNC